MSGIRFLPLAAVLLMTACAAVGQALYPVNEDAHKVRPGDYILDGSHTKVIFGISHMGFSTFYGQFREIEGRLHFDGDAPERSEVAVRIQTASIDTGSGTLDDMLRAGSMFDSARFPTASFTSTSLRQAGDDSGILEGLLTIKEITRPVTLEVHFGGSGTNPASGLRTVGFNATGGIRRSEFDLKDWLPFVGDDVSLTIEAEFTRP